MRAALDLNNLICYNYKYRAFLRLISKIKRTKLMDKHYSLIETKFISLLNVLDKLPDYNKYDAFSLLFGAIKGTKLMDKHYSLIETKFISLLNILDKLPDDDKYKAFYRLIGVIKGTKLMSEKFFRKFDKLKFFK